MSTRKISVILNATFHTQDRYLQAENENPKLHTDNNDFDFLLLQGKIGKSKNGTEF